MYSKALVFVLMVLSTQSVMAGRPDTSEFSDDRSSVVTQCAAPVEFSDRHQLVALGQVTQPSIDLPLTLTLTRHQNNYDLLVDGTSINAKNSLTSITSGAGPIHLVLDNGSAVEHFLFVLNPDGSGELLWSSATASALTTCDTHS